VPLRLPPSLELVGLGGLISWINETSSSLLPATQLYDDFCAMVAARSLMQSVEMTGCDHHTALQRPSFQYPSDLSTSAVTKALKSTARSFTTNYWCKHGRELALREAELNRQRVWLLNFCFVLSKIMKVVMCGNNVFIIIKFLLGQGKG
jgi:hypothetical protein